MRTSSNPLVLARAQLAHDRRSTSRFVHLFGHKLRRMSASPLAYLRGAAHLFYLLLAERPDLAEGPPGKGWLVGDAHLENFGAYRAHTAFGSKNIAEVVFDLNDFDEAARGPLRLDVLRLTTSLLLASRELRVGGKESVHLAHALIDAYRESAFERARKPSVPRPVEALLAQVRARTPRDLLASRTERAGDAVRFVRGERYRALPGGLFRPARRAFEKYLARLDKDVRPTEASTAIADMAFRIAGTGSLGRLRVAVLLHGKSAHRPFLFDMKEQGPPAASVLLGPRDEGDLAPARRVMQAMQASLEHTPRFLGATKIDGLSMLVRRLSPQEDKLALDRIEACDLAPLARYLGALLGRAHRRGALKPAKRPWTKEDRDDMVERAIVVAGVHEAAYLEMCRRGGG